MFLCRIGEGSSHFLEKSVLYINLQLTKKVLIATMKFDIKGRKLVSEYGKW